MPKRMRWNRKRKSKWDATKGTTFMENNQNRGKSAKFFK